jgi:hypothetical protein
MVGSCLAPLIICFPQRLLDCYSLSECHGDTGGAFCISYFTVAEISAVMSTSSKKEFRTSVILTEAQFNKVREVARASDASIAWVVRQAVDRYLEAEASRKRNGNQ